MVHHTCLSSLLPCFAVSLLSLCNRCKAGATDAQAHPASCMLLPLSKQEVLAWGWPAGGGLAYMNNIPVAPGDVYNGFVGEGGYGIFANGTDR